MKLEVFTMDGQHVKKTELWIALQCAEKYYGKKLQCDLSEMINALVLIFDLHGSHGGDSGILLAYIEAFRQTDVKFATGREKHAS